MRWTYDGGSDSLYVYVGDEPIAGQRELADGTIADITEDGSLVGFEVLSLRSGWSPDQLVREFGAQREPLTLLAHGLFGATVAVQPRLAGSAARMPELVTA